MIYIKKIVFITMVLSMFWFSFASAARAQANPGCKIECKTCASTCQQTLTYCRVHGHTDAKHIKALQDCISTCKQSADFMARGSALQNSACALCEKACLSCADSCATFKGDKTMQACADECRKCADSCHNMASANTGG